MAKCPRCEFDNAYVGFTNVECCNVECKYFSEKQFAYIVAESKNNSPNVQDESGHLDDEPMFGSYAWFNSLSTFCNGSD